MGFKLRILLLNEYSTATKELESIASGDEEILHKILDYCRIQISNPSFLHWNGASVWLVQAWQEYLQSVDGNASIATAKVIAPIVIALRCMPLFQFSYLSGQKKSPNLVVLGEDDGGLYGILRDADPWFDDLFLERFQNATERYAVGQAMFLLNQADLSQLSQLVRSVQTSGNFQVPGFAESWCSETRERLSALVQRTLSTSHATIAVSDQ